MRTIDPISHIRSNPAMYLPQLPGGVDLSSYLAERLVSDAMTLGATHVDVCRNDDWWTVASDKDWLAGQGESDVAALFAGVVPFPKAGVNSMRAEVLLTAFARDILTSDEQSAQLIKGDFPSNWLAWKLPSPTPWVRIVRFRM
jgi:hypothetical protein